MEHSLLSLGILAFLLAVCQTLPIDKTLETQPQEEILLVEIDTVNSDPQPRPRQEDGGDAGVEAAAEGAFGAQAIGNNVIKVVTSALTGNVGGIFSGSFDLFGTGPTRNNVEGFFNNLVGNFVTSIVGSSTTPDPNKPAAAAASPAGVAEAAVATTPKASGTQYVILLNQNGGQIKGASLVSPQNGVIQTAGSVPAATATAAPATTKKAVVETVDEDDDDETRDDKGGRSL